METRNRKIEIRLVFFMLVYFSLFIVKKIIHFWLGSIYLVSKIDWSAMSAIHDFTKSKSKSENLRFEFVLSRITNILLTKMKIIFLCTECQNNKNSRFFNVNMGSKRTSEYLFSNEIMMISNRHLHYCDTGAFEIFFSIILTLTVVSLSRLSLSA